MLVGRLQSVINKIGLPSSVARAMSTQQLETIKIEPLSEHVMHVSLNRPDKRNALNRTMWLEVGEAFKLVSADPKCRSVVFSGEGSTFCAGMDVMDFMTMAEIVMGEDDIARKSRQVKKILNDYQESFSAIEKCPKPVVAAVWGPCIGAGMELLTATDIRLCSSDSWYQIKEIKYGFSADIGSLQRFPKIIGSQSLVNDLCLTCRKMPSDEALSSGLVSRVLPDKDATMKAAVECAEQIASNSPVATQATKMTLIHARDHTVQEGLEYVALLNMAFLQSEDVRISAMSQMQKDSEKPQFADF